MSDLQKFYYKNNRLQQIRGFVSCVKYGGITEASIHMNLSKSAISHQISSLESDLGIELFKKNGVRIELTELGREFYNTAAVQVQGIDSIFEEFIKKKNLNHQNTLYLSAHHVPMCSFLPKIFTSLAEISKDFIIEQKNYDLQKSIDQIILGELDVGVFPLEVSKSLPPEVDAVKIADYEIITVFHKDHSLSKFNKDTISLKEITKHRLLFESKNQMTSSILSSIFYTNNRNLSMFRFENANLECLYSLTRENIGVSGFDAIYCKTKNLIADGLGAISIKHLLPEMCYVAIIKKNIVHKTILNSFLQELSKFNDIC
jgi:DNA-binding transcriptional LysR family regulator